MTAYGLRCSVWLQAIPIQKLARPHVAHGQSIAATFEIEHPDSGQLSVLSTTPGHAVDPSIFEGAAVQRLCRGERLAADGLPAHMLNYGTG